MKTPINWLKNLTNVCTVFSSFKCMYWYVVCINVNRLHWIFIQYWTLKGNLHTVILLHLNCNYLYFNNIYILVCSYALFFYCLQHQTKYTSSLFQMVYSHSKLISFVYVCNIFWLNQYIFYTSIMWWIIP